MNNPKRWSAALGAGLALSLGSVAPAATAASPPSVARTAPSAVAGPTAGFGAHLPADWQSRRDAVAKRFGVEQSVVREALARAINPGDYDCKPTDLDSYIGGLFAGMSDSDLEFLFSSGVLDFPTYDALVFGTSADPQYALTPEYRQQLTSAFRGAKKFWDIKSGDIQLLAMHGNVLQDPARLERLLTVVFGLTDSQASGYARYIVDTVAEIPAFQRGDNPLFTLNAFAYSNVGDPDPLAATIPDKLVFGDGILDALESMGIADVGPRAVLGHEFGHHVQFEDNLFESDLTGAEATRRTELMADAFGTYFATHSRGLSLNTKRVLQAEKTFYEVGDCAFDSPGHHGTPNQRVRASTWGAQLADSAQKQGHVLPSLTVAEKFDAALQQFVVPDVG